MQNSSVMKKHSEIEGERLAWSHFWINKGLKAVEVLVIFYTEILMRKVVLWCFFMSEMSEKSTIQLFESKSQYRTYFFK